MTESEQSKYQVTEMARSCTLTQTINQAPDFYWALNVALNYICETTDWDYGEVWISSKSGSFLARSSVWSLSTRLDVDRAVSWMHFRRSRTSLIHHPGEEELGRVWRSQQPEWIGNTDPPPEIHFLPSQIAQSQIAKVAGAKSGLAVPLLLQMKLQAVLVFFMGEARQRDESLVQATQATVTQLEQLLLRFPN